MTSDQKNRQIEIVVPPGSEQRRLDRFLAEQGEIDLTRSRLQKLITGNLVTVNGEAVSKSYSVADGDRITISIPPPEASHLDGEDIPLNIVFEDEYFAVVNKPAAMVTHPGAGNRSGTLVNALIHHFKKLAPAGGEDRPGIVHRLDKNTSGLLLVAKTDDVYLTLQKAIQGREVKRTYLALVCGHMTEDSGLIDLPIGRSIRDRKKMSVTHIHSREAQTSWQLIDRFRSYDKLEVSLQTGRTHQIRVHFSHLGHPVFGDPEYGGRDKWHRGIFGPEKPLAKKLLALLDRQALHAMRLEFLHPVTQEELVFEANPPEDFRNLIDMLEKEGR